MSVIKKLELERTVGLLQDLGVDLCPVCKTGSLDLRVDAEGLAVLVCEGCDEGEIWLKLREMSAMKSRRRPVRRGVERPEVLTAEALGQRKIKKTPHVIPGLITRGVTLLAGTPKAKKSFLLADWCVAIGSEDRKAMARFGCEHGDVLYVSLEDSWERLQDRLFKMLGGRKLPPRMHLALEWPAVDQGGEELIDEWMEEHPDTKLIGFDTFEVVRPTEKKEGNPYRRDYADVRWFKQIADRHGISIVLVHHLNQSPKSGEDDIFRRINGTAGLIGAADTNLVLEVFQDRDDAVLHFKGRDVGGKLGMSWIWDSWSWVASSHCEWDNAFGKK
jgi:hypothetical protein